MNENLTKQIEGKLWNYLKDCLDINNSAEERKFKTIAMAIEQIFK